MAPQIIPPHNQDAERVVLGAVLLDRSLLLKSFLSVDDFYFPRHKEIFKAYAVLEEERAPIDLITLAEKLSPEDLLVANSCASETLSTANFSYYEGIVREMAVKRRIQRICLEASAAVNDLSVDEVVAKLRAGIGSAISGRGAELIPMAQVASETSSSIKRRSEQKGEISGVPSGLKDLDTITDGFQNGDLIILAGRPGTGKSALAMHIAHHAAREKKPVGFISLEMGSHQLGIRSIASFSRLPMWRLRKGRLDVGHREQLISGARDLSSLPIWFSFTAREVNSIAKVISSMVEDRGCKIIFLDYLQLAKNKDARSREREVAEISWALKTAAQVHDIPIIALAQLNRDSEKQNREPILADLRDSGAIEQDADVVIFLYRKKGNPGEDLPVDLIIAKGRNIGTGTVTVYFNPENMAFGDQPDK